MSLEITQSVVVAEVVEHRVELSVTERVVQTLEINTQGPPGPTYRHRGAWDNATQYAHLDVVLYNGSSYMALTEHSSVAPGSNAAMWQLLASKGDDGDVAGSLPWSQVTGKPTPISLPVTSQGETSFTLPRALDVPARARLFVNGVAYLYGLHWTYDHATLTVTWLNEFKLEPGDQVQFHE
jgi:hypothetical protein